MIMYFTLASEFTTIDENQLERDGIHIKRVQNSIIKLLKNTVIAQKLGVFYGSYQVENLTH